jgi:hypothetical protein
MNSTTSRAPDQRVIRPPRCRRCGAKHRTWRALARCRLRPWLWIIGGGRYASISDCPISGRGEGRTVILYENRHEAADAKAGIDRLGCGGCCRRLHRVADLAAAPRGSSR